MISGSPARARSIRIEGCFRYSQKSYRAGHDRLARGVRGLFSQILPRVGARQPCRQCEWSCQTIRHSDHHIAYEFRSREVRLKGRRLRHIFCSIPLHRDPNSRMDFPEADTAPKFSSDVSMQRNRISVDTKLQAVLFAYDSGFSIRLSHVAPQSWIHQCGRRLPGSWNRRQHCHLQRHRCSPSSNASSEATETVGFVWHRPFVRDFQSLSQRGYGPVFATVL
jgi:hypothetical protein